MKNKQLLLLCTILAIAILICLVSPGCGAHDTPSLFNDDVGTVDAGNEVLDGADTDSDPADVPFFGDVRTCLGLECQQVKCDTGSKTTVSGIVYDPAGKVPLYNVIVYIPNAPVLPFVDGAVCDQCGSTLSGNPLVTAITDTHGHFVLENVPVGQNIPLVLQVGKWRRQVKINAVAACIDTVMTDKNITRLPKNKSEGDIPKIALTTGEADALECLLRKIGIDDAEFTNNTDTGRVNIFQGVGGGVLATATPGANILWDTPAALQKYDLVLLSCEGAEHPETKPGPSLQAMQDYINVGGRVFASHYHYYWFEKGPMPLPSVATWAHDSWPPTPYDFLIDTSFPKGQALSDWLMNVGGSTITGQLTITEGRSDVAAVNPATSQRWIYGSWPKVTTSVQYLTFNTPIEADASAQCGRVVYSDLHVGSGDQAGAPFPTGCVTTDLTPQQKALEFMLFDLSSCIQKDTTVPQAPPR